MPRPARAPARTSAAWARAQNRALLYGPFPSHGLARGISDGVLLLSSDPRVRAFALSRARAAGASVIRIPVDWRNVVTADPPAGFEPTDPASPSYDFASIDAAVRDVTAAGLQPLLVVYHAPAFAEAPDRWRYAYPGSWAPAPVALEQFSIALASRYDGRFPDPSTPGRTLPRVITFQAWNEPNLPRYLEPQWIVLHGRWTPFSPLLYRQMLNAFYTGVKSVQPNALVVTAGVAPIGDPAGAGRMAPLTFLRELLCLGAPAQSCDDPPHFDVLAFHPLSVGDPDVAAVSSLDVSISDAAKVTTLLAAAERRHTALPHAAKQVWVTELNWEGDPPSPHGVPDRLQAQWVSRALHRLWVAGVSLVDWQFLVDRSSTPLSSPTGGTVRVKRLAGLYEAPTSNVISNARPKPFLRGFTMPFDPLRLDRKHVRVWALLMRAGQSALLQRQTRAGRWLTVARVHADRDGALNAIVALAGSASLRLQSGSLLSAVSKIAGDRGALSAAAAAAAGSAAAAPPG